MTQERYLQQQAQLQIALIRAEVMPRVQADIVPVFTAPEFFYKWRDGLPYDRVTSINSVDFLQAASAQLGDVLWVVGTIWRKEPVTATEARVHNTALVLSLIHI